MVCLISFHCWLSDHIYPAESVAWLSDSRTGDSAADAYHWLLETCCRSAHSLYSTSALLYDMRQRPHSVIAKASDPLTNHRIDMHMFAGYMLRRYQGEGGILRLGCSSDMSLLYIPTTQYRKLCVDQNSTFATHRMTVHEFFATQVSDFQPFDIIIIEGIFNSTDLLHAIDLALPWLSKNGTLLFNGARPYYEIEAEHPKDPNIAYWLGDVWRAIFQLRSRVDVDLAIGDFDWYVQY